MTVVREEIVLNSDGRLTNSQKFKEEFLKKINKRKKPELKN